MRPIQEELAELQTLGVPELVERYVAVFGGLPRVKHRDWLWRRIAWKLQEQRFGGLSESARVRLEELISEIDLPIRGIRKQIKPGRAGAPLGTTVMRVWKGIEVRAVRVDGGWEHHGTVHKSLSAVAKAVTGAHWNGPGFFGLTKRRAKR